MSSSRIPCTRCGKSILPVTALHHQGLCGVCWKIPPFPVRARSFIANAARLVGFCLGFPFMLLRVLGFVVYQRVLSASWRLRFPHDLAAIKQAIVQVHPDPYVASAYLRGVLAGYFKNAPEFCGFSQHLPFSHGQSDGGKLRRGEITPRDIPTHKEEHGIDSRGTEWIRWLLGN